MGLGTFIGRLMGRQEAQTSKHTAKDRLRLVLMHDRTDIPATMMEAIRAELMLVLTKYVEIDNDAMEMQLEREPGAIGLVMNIPIRRVKTEAEAADALATMHAVQTGAPLPAPEPEPNVDSEEAWPAAGASDPDASSEETAPTETLSTPEDADLEPLDGEASPLPQPVAAGAIATEPVSAKAVASVPVRVLNNLKGSDISVLSGRLEAEDDDERTEDASRLPVRDAWYSGEDLLSPVLTERAEPND
ncbi:MAG: cell division topological specificity factor MinE [Candidatus Sericytochromatia bacterium]|nr:cell division topological specificity factor MinE [Candidatus Sericytochromatia bacterium]